MFHFPLSIAFKSAVLVLEAQQVVALRMLRLVGGGRKAEREFQRMFAEKAEVFAETATTAMAALAASKSSTAVAHRAVRGYRTRVRKNRRRLA
jgi:hypothetical protein